MMDKKKSFKFFYELHKRQRYNDGEPYWPHLLRVGLIIQNTLTINEEGTKSERNAMIIAGFGHDSLEDTNMSIELLKEKFGNKIAQLIFGITNEEGDTHTSNYINKICKSSEEIRIIKLADICDNLMRIIQKPNDKHFLRNKILPIIKPMHEHLITTKFKKYTKSSKQLIELSSILMITARDMLNKK